MYYNCIILPLFVFVSQILQAELEIGGVVEFPELVNHIQLAIEAVNDRNDGLFDDLSTSNWNMSGLVNISNCESVQASNSWFYQYVRIEHQATVGLGCNVESIAVSELVNSLPQGQAIISHGASGISLTDKDKYPNNMLVTMSDDSQVSFLIVLLNFFGWNRVAVVHDDTDDNSNLVADLFETEFEADDDSNVVIRGSYSPSSNEEVLVSMLTSLQSTELTVFLLFPGIDRGESVLSVACDSGLAIGEGYVWIATDIWSNDQPFIGSSSLKDCFKGSIGLRPSFDSASINYLTYSSKYEALLESSSTALAADQDTNKSTIVSSASLLVDAVATVAYGFDLLAATEHSGDGQAALTALIADSSPLLNYMKLVAFDGISGSVNFSVSGARSNEYPYQILNYDGSNWEPIGTITNVGNEVIQFDVSSVYDDIVDDIVWADDGSTPGKYPILRIAVIYDSVQDLELITHAYVALSLAANTSDGFFFDGESFAGYKFELDLFPLSLPITNDFTPEMTYDLAFAQIDALLNSSFVDVASCHAILTGRISYGRSMDNLLSFAVANQVPVISLYGGTEFQPESDYYIHLSPSNGILAQNLVDILHIYEWQQAVVVYEHSDVDSMEIMSHLALLFNETESFDYRFLQYFDLSEAVSSSGYSVNGNAEEIANMLQHLLDKELSRIIILITSVNGAAYLIQNVTTPFNVGSAQDGYVWVGVPSWFDDIEAIVGNSQAAKRMLSGAIGVSTFSSALDPEESALYAITIPELSAQIDMTAARSKSLNDELNRQQLYMSYARNYDILVSQWLLVNPGFTVYDADGDASTISDDPDLIVDGVFLAMNAAADVVRAGYQTSNGIWLSQALVNSFETNQFDLISAIKRNFLGLSSNVTFFIESDSYDVYRTEGAGDRIGVTHIANYVEKPALAAEVSTAAVDDSTFEFVAVFRYDMNLALLSRGEYGYLLLNDVIWFDGSTDIPSDTIPDKFNIDLAFLRLATFLFFIFIVFLSILVIVKFKRSQFDKQEDMFVKRKSKRTVKKRRRKRTGSSDVTRGTLSDGGGKKKVIKKKVKAIEGAKKAEDDELKNVDMRGVSTELFEAAAKLEKRVLSDAVGMESPIKASGNQHYAKEAKDAVKKVLETNENKMDEAIRKQAEEGGQLPAAYESDPANKPAYQQQASSDIMSTLKNIASYANPLTHLTNDNMTAGVPNQRVHGAAMHCYSALIGLPNEERPIYKFSLDMFKFYFSLMYQDIFFNFVCVLYLFMSGWERTSTTDYDAPAAYEPSPGLREALLSLEMIIVFFFLADLLVQYLLLPMSFINEKKQMLYVLIIMLVFADFVIQLTFPAQVVRFSRPLRAAIPVLHSKTLEADIKKIIKSTAKACDIVFVIVVIISWFAVYCVVIYGVFTKECVKDLNQMKEDGDTDNEAFIQESQYCRLKIMTFDNIVRSALSVFILLTADNFPEITYAPSDRGSVSIAPAVILYMLIIFIMLSILLAAIFDAYIRSREDQVAMLLKFEQQNLKAAFHSLRDHARRRPGQKYEIIVDEDDDIAGGSKTDDEGDFEYVDVEVEDEERPIDQYVTVQEWRALIKVMKPGLTVEVADFLFAVVDADKSGTLEEEEFLNVTRLLLQDFKIQKQRKSAAEERAEARENDENPDTAAPSPDEQEKKSNLKWLRSAVNNIGSDKRKAKDGAEKADIELRQAGKDGKDGKTESDADKGKDDEKTGGSGIFCCARKNDNDNDSEDEQEKKGCSWKDTQRSVREFCASLSQSGMAEEKRVEDEEFDDLSGNEENISSRRGTPSLKGVKDYFRGASSKVEVIHASFVVDDILGVKKLGSCSVALYRRLRAWNDTLSEMFPGKNQAFRNFVSSRGFLVYSVAALFCNMAVLCLYEAEETKNWTEINSYDNIFMILSILENLARLYGLGWDTCARMSHSRADFVLTTLSSVGVGIAYALGPIYFSVAFRTIRWLRIFVVVDLFCKGFGILGFKIRGVFRRLVLTIPMILRMAAMLFVVMYFFAIIGMEVWSDKLAECSDRYYKEGGAGECVSLINNYDIPRTNFNTFSSSMRIMFEIFFKSEMGSLLSATISVSGNQAVYFWLALYMILVVILLNILNAVIIEVYQFLGLKYKAKKTREIVVQGVVLKVVASDFHVRYRMDVDIEDCRRTSALEAVVRRASIAKVEELIERRVSTMMKLAGLAMQQEERELKDAAAGGGSTPSGGVSNEMINPAVRPSSARGLKSAVSSFTTNKRSVKADDSDTSPRTPTDISPGSTPNSGTKLSSKLGAFTIGGNRSGIADIVSTKNIAHKLKSRVQAIRRQDSDKIKLSDLDDLERPSELSPQVASSSPSSDEKKTNVLASLDDKDDDDDANVKSQAKMKPLEFAFALAQPPRGSKDVNRTPEKQTEAVEISSTTASDAHLTDQRPSDGSEADRPARHRRRPPTKPASDNEDVL